MRDENSIEQRCREAKEHEMELEKIREEMKMADQEWRENGKVKVNNLLFVSLPCTMSIRDMDKIAIQIMELINNAWRKR